MRHALYSLSGVNIGLGVYFGGHLRPEKVDERCGDWNEDLLSRTCKPDKMLVRIDLVGSERLTLNFLNLSPRGPTSLVLRTWTVIGIGEICHS